MPNKLRYYQTNMNRYLNPNNITVERGYQIEVFAEGLNTPTSLQFANNGDIFIANSGYITGRADISILRNGSMELFAEGFNVPLIGLNYRDGDLYVSHNTAISVIRRNGSRQDIIKGLPSYGDYSNCRVDFGNDGKMYFGIGSATNSGIVGNDNLWLEGYSTFHDYPGSYILLNGTNFPSNNILGNSNEIIYTGAFSIYGEATQPFEVKKGITKATGSILRANPDGSDLELVAWGLRSVSYLRFDFNHRLLVSNNGYDVRGSRPIANAPDEFLIITEGTWYGFPDYSGGEPVTLPRFRPEGGIQPELLLYNHPSTPPRPYALFPPDSTIIGFDLSQNPEFSNVGDIFIAEFGSVQLRNIGGLALQYPSAGYRVSKISSLGVISTFAMNKSGFPSYMTGEGGFGRPADIAFGPDGALYILDVGTSSREDPSSILPNTGVIWRVTRAM